MRASRSFVTSAVAVTLLSVAAHAQTTVQTGPGSAGSPHVKTSWLLDGAHVSIEYGRPYLKGRPEAQMMPLDKPWRTGADQATVLTTDKPLKFGTLNLPAGSYTLNTQPGAKSWQLLVGKLKSPGQWGIPYDASLEIGRALMKLGKTRELVEQVTYSIDRAGGTNTLRIEWGSTSASIPFTIGS
jgi:DUF2911 family protein